MFRKLLGFGLIILLLSGIFGGFGSRTRAAYYEGYSDGSQAQSSESVEESVEAAPSAAPYRDGRGGFMGWAAFGVLGFFAIFFKIGFFFLLAMLFMRLLFGGRRWHRGGRGPWRHHRKHRHHGPGHEKAPKWMDDSDDDDDNDDD